MMMTRRQSSSSNLQQQQHTSLQNQPNPRRVSFEGADAPPSNKRRFVGLTGGSQRSRGTTSMRSSASKNVIDPSAVSIPLSQESIVTISSKAITPRPSILRKNPVTVLHGRVMKDQPQQQSQQPNVGLDRAVVHVNNSNQQRRSLSKRMSDMSMEQTTSPYPCRSVVKGLSIRDLLERKALHAQLCEETKQFQQQVATLEHILKKEYKFLPTTASSESPSTTAPSGSNVENGWRIRLLLTKAQDTDTMLWKKLHDYEKTLLDIHTSSSHQLSTSSSNEIRDLQTSCMKLHRDFKLSHKALLMCLSVIGDEDRSMYDLADRSTAVTTAPIVEAVGWTGMSATAATHENSNTISDGSDVDNNDPNAMDPVLSRSISPMPAYTSFREEKKSGRLGSKSRDKAKGPSKVVDDDDEYDAYAENFFDVFANYCVDEGKCCDSRRRRSGHASTSRHDDDDDDDFDEYGDDDHDEIDRPSFWICGDVFDLRNDHNTRSTTTQTSTSANHHHRRGSTRKLDVMDTDENENDDDTDTASFRSSKYYEKWYQQIQENVHSMQLDLLHFRSRSLNRHRANMDDDDEEDDMT